MSFLAKLKGQSKPLPARPPLKQIAFASLGGLVAIGLAGLLSAYTKQPLVMGSLGASCVLLFGYPDSPFSQPRNVILGHFFSTLVGLLFLHFVGPEWWSMALALATALAVMQLTRTVHPPAGSNPLIVFLAGANWSFLLTPSTTGSLILVVWALLYNNLSHERRYPSYW
jgi:CBS-domain-containing membrane protein